MTKIPVLEGFVKRQNLNYVERRLFSHLCDLLKLEEVDIERGLIVFNFILLSIQIRREFKRLSARTGVGDVKLFSSLISQHSSLARSLGFLAGDKESTNDAMGIGTFLRGNGEDTTTTLE
jgi:hypothetical protein